MLKQKTYSKLVPLKESAIKQLSEFSKSILHGDYSKRISLTSNNDLLNETISNLNQLADKLQLNPVEISNNDEKTIIEFIEIVSAYANLDFSQRLRVTDNGTIFDAIATGINLLGDELQQNVASKQELEIERNRLKETKEQAEIANRAKGSFLANMSHEIRTPLNGILGFTEIMLTENLSDEHRFYLETIRSSGKNLAQLINDILDLSKIESGKLELEKIEFNLSKVINANINAQKPLAEQKGLKLSLDIDQSIPKEVLGDPVRIGQIFTNLIGNAVKFTEEGCINISVSLINQKDDELTIEGRVKDTGIGIPPGKEETIFQTFTQSDETITRRFGGTGLGLSIVKSLVSQMGGNISVNSPVNKEKNSGTEFIFSIKLALPKGKYDNNFNDSEAEKLNPVEILIVDDNRVNLIVAQKMLEHCGASVTTAISGKDAIEKVKLKDFGIILLDIQMPEIDGYKTATILRGSGYKKPIIALSASAYREDIRKSLDAGMNDHIQKPFTIKQLVSAINKYTS